MVNTPSYGAFLTPISLSYLHILSTPHLLTPFSIVAGPQFPIMQQSGGSGFLQFFGNFPASCEAHDLKVREVVSSLFSRVAASVIEVVKADDSANTLSYGAFLNWISS